MPVFNLQTSKYVPPKGISFSWDNFRGGLNTLLRPTELKPNELAQADNLILVGEGIPTKRPGTSNYFMGGETGSVNLVKGVYFKDGTNELLSITGGYAAKKSGGSYSPIAGASFASGYNAQSVEIQNNVYIVNGVDKITKYAGGDLVRFNPLSTPANVAATMVSGASINPSRTYSYRVTALSPIGETLGSTRASVVSGPQDLSTSLLRLSWDAVSAASGDLIGYQIYGRNSGDETFLAKVNKDTTKWDDTGDIEPSLLTGTPSADTTDGPICKYIIKFGDKLVLGGVVNEPSRVMWSGGGANVDKFHWSYGGGYVDIAKDDGDQIRGLYSYQNNIIVFKERSIWQVTLSATSAGWVLPSVKQITASHGCVSHRTIRSVENDIFFLSRNGVYVLGYEPNIMADVLRTNELSAKIRPTIGGMNVTQIENSSAIYWDYKYILTYPASGEGVNTKMIVYDRERTAWMGPWNVGANGFELYYDTNNNEKLLYGDTGDTYVTEMSNSIRDDKDTAIATFLRTKKEDFKDWSLFKQIKDVFFNFRNVLGSVAVNIRLEGKAGETTTAKSFTVESSTGASGFGTDQWGTVEFGLSNNIAGSALNEIIKQSQLLKTARAIQLEVQTSNRNDVYELIGIRADARLKSSGARPSQWRA